jgi:hypothetical protein
VLSPVPCHERQAHEREGDQEDEDGSRGIDIFEQNVQERIIADLASAGFECHHRLASSQEVTWQIEPDQEVESAYVLQKVIDVVALVPDCGREIVRTVAFHVMVLDVVEVVRVPRMSHQWIQDVWEQLVDDSVLLVEHSTGVNVLMLQKRICSSIPTLHDAMKDGVPPVEVVEQVNGRW